MIDKKLIPFVVLLSLLIVIFVIEIFVFFNAGQENPPFVEFSYKPGTYNEDIELAVKNFSPGVRIFYGFVNNDEEKIPLLPFNRTLRLSAIPGEKREYQMMIYLYKENTAVLEKLFLYVIDKETAPEPRITVLPGAYNKAVTFRFITSQEQSFHYTVNTPPGTADQIWNGTDITLAGEEGVKKSYLVQAYCIGENGNRSKTVPFKFIIDKTADALVPPALTIISPVTGTFANKQILLLDGKNLDWIKYTWDGSDPLQSGKYWSAPLLLPATGTINLRAVGKPRWQGSEYVTASVKFTVTEESDALTVDYQGGVYDNDLSVTPSYKPDTWFNYTLDGTTPTASSTVAQAYINLKGTENSAKNIDLRIKFLKSAEVFSGEYRYLYRIDKRQVKTPVLSVETPGPYTGEVKVRLTSPGAAVYYTIDGTTPDEESALAEGTVTIPRGRAGEDGYVLLKAVAIHSGGSMSDPVFFPLAFKPAETLPVEQRSTTELKITSRDITIPVAAGEKSVYEITTGNTVPPDPGLTSQVADGDIVITIPPGMQLQFNIKLARIINNTIQPVSQSGYIIDKKPPLNPVIRDLPQEGFSNTPVSFSFEETGGKVYYQITEDESEPRIVADLSPRYFFPVTLKGRDNADLTYRINAIAVDDYGNAAPLLTETRFRIDKKNPPIPGAPVLAAYGSEVEQKFTLYWELDNSYRIYYRLMGDLQFSENFLPYMAPVLLDFSVTEKSIYLESYQQDSAGNKSPVITFQVNPPGKEAPPPVAIGVQNGGIYNRKVALRFSPAEGDVHYELATDGQPPPEVQITSPVAARELFFDAEDGKSAVYAVRAKVFNEKTWNITTGELLLTFTIDKRLPDLPELEGVENNGYYYTSLKIVFNNKEDAVFYALAESEEEYIKPQSTVFLNFEKPFILEPQPGKKVYYRITAFSRDKAGNTSKSFAIWNFTIDKKGTYVSTLGNDLFDGTREKPFLTLLRGLEYAAGAGRKEIYLSTGNFAIDRSLTITHEVDILGGYNPFTWEKDSPGKQTVLFTAKPFRGGYPLLEVIQCRVKLDRIQITDPLNACPVIVKQTGARLVLAETGIELNSVRGAKGLYSLQGSLELGASRFFARDTPAGTLLEAEGGNIVLSAAFFQGPDKSEDFTCIRITDSGAVLLHELTVNPGTGKKTIGINALNSRLEFLNCKIDSGAGEKNAVAVNLRGGSLKLTKTIINGNPKAGYAVGILANSGELNITESIINVDGEKGATGLNVSGAEINLYRSYLRARDTKEFIYLINLAKSSGLFFNNLIRGAGSGDMICVLLDDVRSQWINNTIIGGKGDTLMAAFRIKGRFASDIINNIILHEWFNLGNAIHLVGNEEPGFILACNNFSGWNKLLALDFTGGSGKVLNIYNPGKYNMINTVEQLNHLDADPFGGNIYGNISESYFKTFYVSKLVEHHLSAYSTCINAGMDVSSLGYSELEYDIDGDKRPAPGIGIRPACDIGVDEYTEK